MSYYTLCLSFVLCLFKNSSVLLHFVVVCIFYFFHDCVSFYGLNILQFLQLFFF